MLSTKSFIWQIALIMLAVAGYGCSSPASDAIRFGLASAPISLDPRFATDAASSRINRLLYQRLVDFDAQFNPVPSLAEWALISPVHYRFSLLEQLRQPFENGRRLSAVDVKTTYDFMLDEKNASPHRGSLLNIESIEVIDETTIDFRLKQPDPLFPGHLVIGIVPAEALAEDWHLNKHSQGSGHFRFVAWPSSDHLIIERKDDQLRVEFIHVQDATVRVLKLLRGEIDLLQNDLPRELVHYLEQQDTVRVKHKAGNNFTYLGFNMQDSQLTDIRVRKAIAHAIDRESLIHYLLGGKTRPANALLGPEHWAGLRNGKPYRFDPERAKRLLAAAGYHDQHPLTLQYKTSSDPFRIRIATIIQHQLAQVGIQLSLQSYDWATFYGDIKAGRFQLYSLSWVGIKSPDIFRYVFHSRSVPPQGANRGHYANPTIDRLLDHSETQVDSRQRALVYHEIQQRLLDDLPYVPLWFEAHFVAARGDINNYQMATDGNYDGLLTITKTPLMPPAKRID